MICWAIYYKDIWILCRIKIYQRGVSILFALFDFIILCERWICLLYDLLDIVACMAFIYFKFLVCIEKHIFQMGCLTQKNFILHREIVDLKCGIRHIVYSNFPKCIINTLWSLYSDKNIWYNYFWFLLITQISQINKVYWIFKVWSPF